MGFFPVISFSSFLLYFLCYVLSLVPPLHIISVFISVCTDLWPLASQTQEQHTQCRSLCLTAVKLGWLRNTNPTRMSSGQSRGAANGAGGLG